MLFRSKITKQIEAYVKNKAKNKKTNCGRPGVSVNELKTVIFNAHKYPTNLQYSFEISASQLGKDRRAVCALWYNHCREIAYFYIHGKTKCTRGVKNATRTQNLTEDQKFVKILGSVKGIPKIWKIKIVNEIIASL